MAGKCIFVTGGARSGKSRFAQELADGMSRNVLFVATAEPLDTDMKARIKKHQHDRPDFWRTLEAPVNVAEQIAQNIDDAEVVLLDCLTLLVSNVMLGRDRGFTSEEIDVNEAEDRVVMEIQSIIDFAQKSESTFIIVSNEVGLGIVPENRFARIYRDLSGKANQLVASHADEVYFMVSGIPMKVKPQ